LKKFLKNIQWKKLRKGIYSFLSFLIIFLFLLAMPVVNVFYLIYQGFVIYKYGPVKECLRYTILPEPRLNEELILKIELILREDAKDAVLKLFLPNGLQIEPPEGMEIRKESTHTYLLTVGGLEGGKRYEYDLKLRIARTGYWRSRISLRADGGGSFVTSAARFIKVDKEGGRIEDWDFETFWERIRYNVGCRFMIKM